MMHTKSGEGRAFTVEKKEGRKEREGENGQKSKNHPREEEKEAEGEQKARKEREIERKRKRRINGFLLTGDAENVFFCFTANLPGR